MDCGFFYVVNHGITEQFMDEVFSQSRRMFSLPLSEKMKLLRNKKHRGYTPLLDEHLDHENQVHGWFFIVISLTKTLIPLLVCVFWVFVLVLK